MAVFVEIGGSYLNPINVQAVELATETREIKREGLAFIQETAYIVNLVMRDGMIKSVEAVSKDPAAHDKLLKEVVHALDIGLNTRLAVEG